MQNNRDNNTLEVWQRGAIQDVPALLQPAAHALLQSLEDIEKYMHGFPAELLWVKPFGLASVGFHLQHLAGVVDRLFTYARGEALTDEQLNALANEDKPPVENCSADFLTGKFRDQLQKALAQLKTTDENTLTETRGVGRKQIPSTVIGLLFHAAEHTQRHVGQLLVTSKMLLQQQSELHKQ